MPEAPKTPKPDRLREKKRMISANDIIWDAVTELADAIGTSRSGVVRDALLAYSPVTDRIVTDDLMTLDGDGT